jgi:hypothetical protein
MTPKAAERFMAALVHVRQLAHSQLSVQTDFLFSFRRLVQEQRINCPCRITMCLGTPGLAALCYRLADALSLSL